MQGGTFREDRLVSTKHFLDVNRCSAGTFASITGLRSNESISRFSQWIARNHSSLPQRENFLLTIEAAWNTYSSKTKN